MGSNRVNIKQQASSKISKKDHRHRKLHHHHQQHQHHRHHVQEFNNLINDLKPKVYITDSSNFKQLVQDLTGNNNNNNGSPNISSSTTSSSSKVHDLHQHHQVQFSVEPSVSTDQAPTTTTTTSSEEFYQNDKIYNMIDTDELMMVYKEIIDEDLDGLFGRSNINNNQMVVQISEQENETVFEDILACDYDQINYLESLLLDDNHQVVNAEQPLISDPFYPQIIHPEIDVYDYDFSGLIN